MSKLQNARKRFFANLPNNRILRVIVGACLVVGGILGFLPILGFWMIPLGLLVLSIDFPAVRHKRREWEIKLGRRYKKFRGRSK